MAARFYKKPNLALAQAHPGAAHKAQGMHTPLCEGATALPLPGSPCVGARLGKKKKKGKGGRKRRKKGRERGGTTPKHE